MYYEYTTKDTQRIEEGKKEKVFVKTKKKTRVYGVKTTKSTRPLMFDILDETIDEINNIIDTVKSHNKLEGKDFTNGNINRIV